MKYRAHLEYMRFVTEWEDGIRDGILPNQINAEEIQAIKKRFGFVRTSKEHVDLSLLCETFPYIPEIQRIYEHRGKFRS